MAVTPINQSGPLRFRAEALGEAMNDVQETSRVRVAAERTAKILVERHGSGAFDFAARQVAILDLADRAASADNWRAIAREVERLQGGVRH